MKTTKIKNIRNEDVFNEIKEISGYWSYLKSIDWADPCLMFLIFLHILITTLALTTTKRTNFQMFLFLMLLSLVYFSEDINEYAAKHWQTFTFQQYFDSSGLFISTVFSIPILLNCMLLIGSWLYSSTQMMHQLKVAKLNEKSRRENRNNAKSPHIKCL